MLSALVAVVHDDADIRSLLESWLSVVGVPVEQHADGRVILERNTAELSVVCLDVGLRCVP